MVEAALIYYGGQKILDNTPLPLNLERDNDTRLLSSPIKFPGKLEVDILNNRLFISDSNHNRIVSSLEVDPIYLYFQTSPSPLPIIESTRFIQPQTVFDNGSCQVTNTLT